MLAQSVPLWPNQETLLDEALEAMMEHRRILIQSPTGSGKTRIITKIAHGAAQVGRSVIIGVHLEELIDQVSGALHEFGIPHGRLVAGAATPIDDIVVASIPTMVRRLDEVEAPFFYFRDEAHHSVAETDLKVLNHFSSSLCAGMTATPTRLDGTGLINVYSHMVTGPSIKELIALEKLVQPVLYGPPVEDLDMTELAKALKNGTQDEINEIVSKSKIVGVAVEHYLRICPGAQAIAFFVSVAEAEKASKAFRAAGVAAEFLHGGSNKFERRNKVELFRQRKITVLCNVGLFLEGFDVPCVEVVIWAKPTRSITCWMQGNGRAMRADEGKDHCKILDMVGNWERPGLGLPEADRDWSLYGRDKGTAEKAEPLARCQKCHYVGAPFRVCPDCGTEREIQSREISTVNGQLTLITDEKVMKALEKKREAEAFAKAAKEAKTKEALLKLARDKGLPDPEGWAATRYAHKQAARQRYQQGDKKVNGRWASRKTK